MDLWCDESNIQIMNQEEEVEADCLEAFPDENILQDDRVLERLLLTESRCLPSSPCHVFSTIQTELLPGMRKVLTNWMLEVSFKNVCYISSYIAPFKHPGQQITSTVIFNLKPIEFKSFKL